MQQLKSVYNNPFKDSYSHLAVDILHISTVKVYFLIDITCFNVFITSNYRNTVIARNPPSFFCLIRRIFSIYDVPICSVEASMTKLSSGGSRPSRRSGCRFYIKFSE